jgi:hypothetical protein
MPPQVFIWNIDLDDQQYFADELEKNRLRQGWGYDDKLDLRRMQQKVKLGQTLDDQEKVAWDRLNVMVQIKSGDIILVKNVPTPGFYTLVEVVGGYDYSREPPKDHRHVLAIKFRRRVHKLSVHVSGDLRVSIDRAGWPITPAIKRGSEILNLLEPSLPDKDLVKPAKWQQRIDAYASNIVPRVVKDVINRSSPGEFEQLIYSLLEEEGFENTTLTAGPAEKGADIVMSVSTPFFDELNVVVQIKHHHPIDNDRTSVNQLRTAFAYYPQAVAGLLVTSAAKIGPDLEKELNKLRADGKIVEVLYGDELYRRVLRLLGSGSHDEMEGAAAAA